jgi:hypothetical protein
MRRHLSRAVLLLVTLFAVVFVVPRIIPVSAAMVDFGFHKRNAVQDANLWASRPVEYLQSATCAGCHIGEYSVWENNNHKSVACENCHGSAREHLEKQTPLSTNRSRELCGTCHERVVGRPSIFPQVDMDEMGGTAECVVCHSPHDPRAGMPPQVPHALGDRANCQSCHSPHESLDVLPPKVPHTMEGRTDCLSCHGSAELRGATLPKPLHSLEGRADCLMCHNPGGVKPFPADHVGRTSPTCLICHRSS